MGDPHMQGNETRSKNYDSVGEDLRAAAAMAAGRSQDGEGSRGRTADIHLGRGEGRW